jgi:hypothetical protein
LFVGLAGNGGDTFYDLFESVIYIFVVVGYKYLIFQTVSCQTLILRGASTISLFYECRIKSLEKGALKVSGQKNSALLL